MLKKDVIDFYGSKSAVARALNISPSAVTQWEDVVPEKQAYRIQILTGGRLKINPKLYPVQRANKPK